MKSGDSRCCAAMKTLIIWSSFLWSIASTAVDTGDGRRSEP